MFSNITFLLLRFYFSAYEADQDYPSQAHYKGKMTLVFVQTYELKDPTTGQPVRDEYGRPVQKDNLENPTAPPAYDPPLVEYNDGQLCPPPECDPQGLLKFP